MAGQASQAKPGGDAAVDRPVREEREGRRRKRGPPTMCVFWGLFFSFSIFWHQSLVPAQICHELAAS